MALSSRVPVVTQDELGIIAGHTNHMIDGLRHRFELVSALKLAEVTGLRRDSLWKRGSLL